MNSRFFLTFASTATMVMLLAKPADAAVMYSLSSGGPPVAVDLEFTSSGFLALSDPSSVWVSDVEVCNIDYISCPGTEISLYSGIVDIGVGYNNPNPHAFNFYFAVADLDSFGSYVSQSIANQVFDFGTLTVSQVPEPPSLSIFGLSVIGLGAITVGTTRVKRT